MIHKVLPSDQPLLSTPDVQPGSFTHNQSRGLKNPQTPSGWVCNEPGAFSTSIKNIKICIYCTGKKHSVLVHSHTAQPATYTRCPLLEHNIPGPLPL